jgi:hypothetical protein
MLAGLQRLQMATGSTGAAVSVTTPRTSSSFSFDAHQRPSVDTTPYPPLTTTTRTPQPVVAGAQSDAPKDVPKDWMIISSFIIANHFMAVYCLVYHWYVCQRRTHQPFVSGSDRLSE